MLRRSEFHRLWPPVLLVFQLFGLTAYSRPAASGWRFAGRVVVAAASFAVAATICAHTLLNVASIHEAKQINVMSDQLVYLISLPAHLIGLIEALLRQRQTEQLFDGLYEIYAALGRVSKIDVADGILHGTRRRLLVRNWLQVGGLFAILTGGIALTGVQSWGYFRWIVLAQWFISVRLMEVSMHVELLAAMLNALERFVLDSPVDCDPVECVRVAAEIYGMCYAHGTAISRAFGWSLLVMSVYALDGMVNNTYWFVYAMYTGAVKV